MNPTPETTEEPDAAADLPSATVGPNLLPRTRVRRPAPWLPLSAGPVLSWRADASRTPIRRAEPRARAEPHRIDVRPQPVRIVRVEPGSPRWEAAFGLWSRRIAGRKSRVEPASTAEPVISAANDPDVNTDLKKVCDDSSPADPPAADARLDAAAPSPAASVTPFVDSASDDSARTSPRIRNCFGAEATSTSPAFDRDARAAAPPPERPAGSPSSDAMASPARVFGTAEPVAGASSPEGGAAAGGEPPTPASAARRALPVHFEDDETAGEWPYADELPYVDPRSAGKRRRRGRGRSRPTAEAIGGRTPEDWRNRPRSPRPDREACAAMLEELASLRTVETDERGRLTLKIRPGGEMRYLNLRNRLMEIHRPFCAWVISRERLLGRCRTLTWDDHFQNAVIGLARALDLFDPYRGAQFSTYAYSWIRQTILRAREMHDGLIRVPKCTSTSAWKAGTPLPAAAVECVGDGYRKLGPKVPAPIESNADEGAADYREKIRRAVDDLPERQARILRLRFGFDDGFAWTLSEVGERFRVTRERVRQIEKKGLERLALRLTSSGSGEYGTGEVVRRKKRSKGESGAAGGNGDGKNARAPKGRGAEPTNEIVKEPNFEAARGKEESSEAV